MRRPMNKPFGWAVLIVALGLAGSSCRQPETVPLENLPEQESQELASVIHMADPKAAPQLKSGFHNVEQNAWRWTERHFAVVLRPPAGGASRGARLNLRFSIPAPVIEKLGAVTLSAAIGGVSLGPETYSRSGEYIYTRDVPASLLAGDAVTVEFDLDKALPPGNTDQRELGVVASSVGFEAK